MNEESQVSEASQHRYPPAPRFKRLFAKLIDNLITALALTPFSALLGIEQMQQYFIDGVAPPISVLLKLHLTAFLFFAAINDWWLYRYGQTLGKRYLKIAISTADYQVPHLNRIVLVRHLPFFVARAIPVLNLLNLVNVLMIFRQDRRCLHDLMAGTQVIDISQAG